MKKKINQKNVEERSEYIIQRDSLLAWFDPSALLGLLAGGLI